MSEPHVIVSCSLREGSHSAVLAEELARHLRSQGREVEAIDLRDLDLPLCDDEDCYSHADVVGVRALLAGARTVTLAVPIYNFDVGGAARNLVAVTGNAWRGKVVGFLCAAGGRSAYMSVMGLAGSLMLDFRCFVVPRFVYATRSAFAEGRLVDDEVGGRLDELARELDRVGSALASNGVS